MSVTLIQAFRVHIDYTMFLLGLFVVCLVPACMCNELKERGTRHTSKESDNDVRVDDIMHILQGVCVYDNPKNNIKQLFKNTEAILNDIGIYKDVVALNKKLRTEINWILQETKGYKEVSRIVNLLKMDAQGVCASLDQHAHDCSALKKNGNKVTGIYTIYPGISKGVQVYCDMMTDGGGWTVIQRHSGESENFQRPWKDYEDGFGDASGDYWLGNRALHTMTSKDKYELRIHLYDTSQNLKYAVYKSFKIGDSSSKYKLSIGDYSGNAGDKLGSQNGMKFSTNDQDLDSNYSYNCAGSSYYGPWWHSSCGNSALNRRYTSKPYWSGVSVVRSVMMIRKLKK